MSMETSLFIEGDNIQIGIPFVKIDTKKRLVQGFATLDNPDKSRDLLDYDASKEAFASWPGNIREMHQKIAVGKAVSVLEKDYTATDGTTYNGFWVQAKISKGAEDTWQKILDGTLTAFSVGGSILEKRPDTGPDGLPVMRITKYLLTELSVVDNPANGLAGIALVKNLAGTEVLDDEGGDKVAEELNKDDGAMEEDAHGPDCSLMESDHLDKAVQEVNNYVDHLRTAGQTDRAAHGMHLVGALQDTKKGVQHDAVEAAGMNKDIVKDDEKLLNNEQSDNSSDILSEQDKGMLRKFIDFVTGAKIEEASDKENLNKKEGDTTDMDKEELKATLVEVIGDLAKGLDEKFNAVGESLTKADDRLNKLADKELVEELKKSIEDVVGRVVALENSGAEKKSTDSAGATELKKSDDGGLWSDSIVPEFLQKRFSN